MSPRKRKKCRFQIEMLEGRIALSYLEGVPTAPAVVAPKPGGASIARPALRLGSQGEDVRSLQGSLERLGYGLGSHGVDGKFGQATERAVQAFQEANHLDRDGIVGPLTWVPWKGNARRTRSSEGGTSPTRVRPRRHPAPLPRPAPARPPELSEEKHPSRRLTWRRLSRELGAPPPAGADHRTGLLLPAAITPGTDKYYQLRARDFMRRHPEMSPPDYYLSYGDYYMRTLLGINFSDEGKAWAGRTRDALQRAIEKKRMEDPYGFDSLERDPDRFRDYAFSTHYKAYSDSGFYQLSAQDIIKPITHIKLHDLLSREGLHQDYDLGAGKITHIKDDFVSIGRTFREAVVDTGEMIKDAGNEAEKVNDFISGRGLW